MCARTHVKQFGFCKKESEWFYTSLWCKGNVRTRKSWRKRIFETKTLLIGNIYLLGLLSFRISNIRYKSLFRFVSLTVKSLHPSNRVDLVYLACLGLLTSFPSCKPITRRGRVFRGLLLVCAQVVTLPRSPIRTFTRGLWLVVHSFRTLWWILFACSLLVPVGGLLMLFAYRLILRYSVVSYYMRGGGATATTWSLSKIRSPE